MNVESTVRQFLRGELGKDESSVGPDDSLLESGTIDSMGVLQLVAFLENTYAVKVDDEDLMPENFDTISAIAAFIERRRAETRG